MNDGFPKRFYPFLHDKERDCSFEGLVDEFGQAVSSSLDRLGREVPDDVPMSPPVGMSSGPSLADFVQRMIRNEVSRAAALEGEETFDEADDFDIEDDPLDPLTEYEAQFDPRYKAVWDELERREKAVEERERVLRSSPAEGGSSSQGAPEGDGGGSGDGPPPRAPAGPSPEPPARSDRLSRTDGKRSTKGE